MVARPEGEVPGAVAAGADGGAPPVHHGKYGAVGAAVRLALKAGWQQLHEGADGRHGPATACRVHIAHLDAMPGVDRTVLLQRVQRFAGTGIRVVEDG